MYRSEVSASPEFEPAKRASLTDWRPLLEDGRRAAGVLFVEHERAAALLGEQPRQPVVRRGRGESRHDEHERRRDRHGARQPPSHERDCANQRPDHGEHADSAHQTDVRDKDEPGEEGARDATHGVDGGHAADVAADLVRARGETCRRRKRRPEQHGRQQQDRR
jgi:hypothetical protein